MVPFFAALAHLAALLRDPLRCFPYPELALDQLGGPSDLAAAPRYTATRDRLGSL
jgi:hypothetical protein